MTAWIKCPLSNEFKVACEIYQAEIEGESIGMLKLIDRLKGKLEEDQIIKAVETLFDWGMIRAEYDPTGAGKSRRLFMIDTWHRERIGELYEHYWRIV